MQQKTISNSFSVNTVYDGNDGKDGKDGKDGTDGKDGVSQLSYEAYQEAWGNSPTDHNDILEADWKDSTPTKTKTYLWRRSRTMELDETTRQYVPKGNWGNYVCLSGTNGTSINTKGILSAVVLAGRSLPTQGMVLGDIGIKQGDATIWRFDGTVWYETSTESADGDSYTMGKDCTIDLDGDGEAANIRGHLLMWSSEASKWIDLGQFQGEPGATYYTHIAWAREVTIGNSGSGATPPTPRPDQKNTPNASEVNYFSISPVVGYGYMGYLVDTAEGDPSWENAKLYYTWQSIKGESAQYIVVNGACHVGSEQTPHPNNGRIVVYNGKDEPVSLTQADIRPDSSTGLRRGFALVAVDRYQMSIDSEQTRASWDQRFYDTYGNSSDARCSELARVINEDVGTNKFICLFSYDAIGWNNDLINALKACGSGGIDHTEPARRPFAFIGYKGLEEGYATQHLGEVESQSVATATVYVADGIMTMSRDGRNGKDGKDGKDGDNAPYDILKYARYTTRTANSQTGAPTGSSDTGWQSVAPAPTPSYPYIWQQTQHYDSSGQPSGDPSYVCLTGLNGPQGQQGLTGRMYYIAGKWNETTQYSRTTDLCPVVYYKVVTNSGTIEWWYLTADNSTGDTPYDGEGSRWAKVENFGVVLTEAIFVKEFAQFGSCIITGDWLISVHGKINSVEKGGSVENPDMYPNGNGSPTYTWFDPLFPGGQLPNLFFDGSTYCANQEHVGWQGDNYDYKELTDVGAFNLLSQDKYAIYRFRMVIVPSNATDYYVHFLLKSGSVRKYLGSKLVEENTQQELTVGNVTLSADGSYMLAAELQYMGNISSWTYPELYSGAADRGLNYVPIFYKSTSGGNPGTPTFTKMEQISGDSSLSNTWCRYNQNSGTVYVSWGLKSNTNTPGFWLKKFYIERTDNYMFIPNYAVDLKTGRSYQNDAHLKGLISTLNDMIVVKEENQTVGNGWLTIMDRGLFCRNDKDDSNNEVIAAIGVHKESQQSYVYEKGFVDLITRAKNSSNYDYATISGTGAYFTRHEIVGGVDQITQTHVNYAYVETNEVRTHKIIGKGYESGYGYLPVAMPQNIITGSGNKYLPANPKEGMVVFAKGTGGNMTVRGNGKKIMNPVGTGEVDDFSILSNSFIFAYDGIRWIAFCCIDT